MRIRAASKLITLIPSCLIHKMLASFSGVEFKDCIEIKEKKGRRLVFTSTKCKMRHFHITVVQLQQRNVQKKNCM